MEDIDSIVDQLLAGHSTESLAVSPVQQQQEQQQKQYSVPAVALPSSSSRAAPSEVVPPPASTAPAGSVEDLVARILRGEDVVEMDQGRAVGTSPSSSPAPWLSEQRDDPNEHDDGDRAEPDHRGPQRVLVPGSWRGPHASPSQPHTGRGNYGAAREEEYRAGQNDDPLLRRFALWQERKDVKRIQSIYEALVKEKEECTFQPDFRPEVLLPAQQQQQPPTPPMQHTRGTSADSRHRPLTRYDEGGIKTQLEGYAVDSRAGSRRSSAWQSLLAPSRLYDNNEAWGFQDHVARVRAAQDARDSREREEEYDRTRFADFSTFRRGPTKFEPFHLSTSSQVRTRTSATNAVAESSHSPVRALPESASRARASSGSRDASRRTGARTTATPQKVSAVGGDGAFDTLAPQLRQALLFTPEMNARLRLATAATLHNGADGELTASSAASEEASASGSRVAALPPTGHFSSSAAALLQQL